MNVNQFIEKEELNLKRETDNLNITVVNKYVYYDYEEYEIIFENNTDKNIILDTKENTESVYIEDTKDVKYTWFGNEVPNSYLNLNSGESKRLRLKFNEIYTGKKTDSTIYLIKGKRRETVFPFKIINKLLKLVKRYNWQERNNIWIVINLILRIY